MKYLIVLLTMFPMLALAEDCNTTTGSLSAQETLEINTDVPKHLKAKTYRVCDENGQNCEAAVSSSKFKIVPRAQQFIVTKTIQSQTTMCKNANKNSLSVLAGHGPKSSLGKTQDSADQVTIENRTGTVLGIQYQRDLGFKVFGLPVHGAGQLQDNETLSGAAGVSW